MDDYRINLEKFGEAYADIEPLCRRHYEEMRERLASEGMHYPDYNPRLNAYKAANEAGELVLFVVRTADGEAVGHSSIWIAYDMHNGELISQEDTIYIRPDHRKGIGRTLTRVILGYLKMRGVKRANVTTMTDLRVSKMCARLGFKHTAHAMTLFFEDTPHVRP